MTVEEKIQAVLIADAAVIAAVPAARISVMTTSQLITRPYIRHLPISSEAEYTYVEGLMGQRKWYYQVSCFADTYTKCREVANLVRAALANLRASDGTQIFWVTDGPHIFEDDVRVHHIPLDFEVVEAL